MSSSVGMMKFSNIWKNNPNVPNHHPDMIFDQIPKNGGGMGPGRVYLMVFDPFISSIYGSIMISYDLICGIPFSGMMFQFKPVQPHDTSIC